MSELEARDKAREEAKRRFRKIAWDKPYTRAQRRNLYRKIRMQVEQEYEVRRSEAKEE